MATGHKRRLKTVQVIPAAARTINSLRDIGYELPQAVADLVDNSIEARATEVRVDVVFEGSDSWIRIADNGIGMDTETITESLRIGSSREYVEDDLGKFGFGLKTASISQCRRVVIASRVAPERARVEARVFDLQHIEATNEWEILILPPEERPEQLTAPLQATTGTVVLWEDLDRILNYKDPEGGWAKRKLLDQTELIANHLGMVFHRFLSGTVRGHRKVKVFVNEALVEPWDPFCLDEPMTEAMEPERYPVVSEGTQGIVTLRPHVLPGQAEFSTSAAWNRASGPNKWNNQQGLYIYRANRLIQWGGWNRLRTNDEHTKMARVALDFSPDLDAAFGINISKAIVRLPTELRDEIQPAIKQVCAAADSRYRRGNKRSGRAQLTPRRPTSPQPAPPRDGSPFGLPPMSTAPASVPPRSDALAGPTLETGAPVTLRSVIERAAQAAGEPEALEKIMTNLQTIAPEVARDLGW